MTHDRDTAVLFSIIIPTYNYGKYLHHALDSALSQPGNDYEIIVVDDGSTDNTVDIIQAYQQKIPNNVVKYLYQNNQGVSVARNNGIQQAAGTYIFFCDADDRLLPNALEYLRQCVADDQNVDCILGSYLTISEHGKTKINYPGHLSLNPETNAKNFMRRKIKLRPGSILIRREILQHHHFSETLRKYEDLVLFTHILALYRCKSISQPIVAAYQHSGSLRHLKLPNHPKPEYIAQLIFNPDVMPAQLMPLYKVVLARLHLSYFHELYRIKSYSEAKVAFYNAVKANPLALFKWLYLKRYMKIIISNSFVSKTKLA